MSDERSESDRKWWEWSASKMFALVLTFYMLGFGLLVRLDEPLAFQSLYIVYAPLEWVSHYRLPGTLLAIYTNLFLPSPQRAQWEPDFGVVIFVGP
jgi:hypothetical protein